MYKTFGKNIEYLRVVGDAETRLLFKCRLTVALPIIVSAWPMADGSMLSIYY